MKAPSYTYRATVTRWVDGDSVDLELDLGFYVFTRSRCRLLGIDTPERGRPGYREATAAAEDMAPAGSAVTIDSKLPADKYGRFLVVVHAPDGTIVNDRLIELGLAVPYDGGKKSTGKGRK